MELRKKGLRLGSLNIMHSSLEERPWQERAQELLQLIRLADLDVICLQEVSPPQARDIVDGLDEFDFAFVSRASGTPSDWPGDFLLGTGVRRCAESIRSVLRLDRNLFAQSTWIPERKLLVLNSHYLLRASSLKKAQCAQIERAFIDCFCAKVKGARWVSAGDRNTTSPAVLSALGANSLGDLHVGRTTTWAGYGRRRRFDWILSHRRPALTLTLPSRASDHALLVSEWRRKPLQSDKTLSQ